MSFLYRATPVLRPVARSTASPLSARLFTTTIVRHKTATDTVKDGLKKVDRTVSDVAVAGIDKGIELKDKAAEVAGIETGKAQGKAAELSGEAKGKAAELKGQAKGAAEEVKGKMS